VDRDFLYSARRGAPCCVGFGEIATSAGGPRSVVVGMGRERFTGENQWARALQSGDAQEAQEARKGGGASTCLGGECVPRIKVW
jgi:hypothetical protein